MGQRARRIETYCAYRDLRNNTEGHSLDVVQQFPLSRGDKRLLGFQESGVIIPILGVKGNRKNIQRNEDSQPLRQPTQLSVHFLDTPSGLHRLYLGKLRNLLFKHPSEVRKNGRPHRGRYFCPVALLIRRMGEMDRVSYIGR